MQQVSNSSEVAAEPRRARVLDAALAVFARYGFRRAAMADIAAQAGMSRPALYLLFRSKEDVLRSLAHALRDRALAAADAAWVEGAPFAENLAATLAAKEAVFFDALHRSPHGAEILAADADLTAAIAADLDSRFRGIIAARAAAAAARGGVDLACVGGDEAVFADLVATAAKALAASARDEADFRGRLADLARLAAAAVRP